MQDVDIWTVVIQVAIILVTLFGGGTATVQLVRWLKQALGTHGIKTQVVAAIVSVTLGLAGLIVEGQIAPDTVGLENLSVWGLAIFFASQSIYRMLKDEGVIKSTHEGE